MVEPLLQNPKKVVRLADVTEDIKGKFFAREVVLVLTYEKYYSARGTDPAL